MRGWNLGQWFRPTSGDTEGRGKTRSKDENNSPTCIHLDLIITKQPLRETEFFRNLLEVYYLIATIKSHYLSYAAWPALAAAFGASWVRVQV